jgi:hypothetical protein
MELGGTLRFDGRLMDDHFTVVAGAEGQEERPDRAERRKVLNGIFFVLRGTLWRDLPER